jgi:FkbH-like protein
MPAVSEEDKSRTRMYTQDRHRAALRSRIGSLDEWLGTLGIRVTVDRLDKVNLARATQLLNKTNQMNLATRRLSEAELINWVASPVRQLWTFQVRDKFGDSGLTGIITLECDDHRAQIVDFILSCRVIGRKIEETMLHVATEWAKSAGFREIYAFYRETPKNKPCLDFFRRSGFNEVQKGIFGWDLNNDYPCPAQISLEHVLPSTSTTSRWTTQEVSCNERGPS